MEMICISIYIELQNLIEMTQRSYELQLTHQELTNILQNMLQIPKSHRPLHPSPQRSKYANLFDWLISAMTSLQRQKHISPKELAQQQQQLITACLGEMIELTRKQCLQKSMVLEIVQEYLICTLNSYWKVFGNAAKQISYEYEHNSVKIQKQYISEIKRLQTENEELKKDKEHRWRNMLMLIKDNRIYRKKNKKLLKSLHYKLQKGRTIADQMISQQFENQKIKAKLDYLEQQTFNLQNYVEMTVKLVQLQKKIKTYPDRCKKMLKNDLINIEIAQIKNLPEKINFIIKAVEETGEIIDEMYDEDVIFSNFHYNISTQTEDNTEDKGVNTPHVKLINSETQTYNREHAVLSHCDTLSLRVKGAKYQKKENLSRDSKNVMSMSQGMSRFSQSKKQQNVKLRKVSKLGDNIQYFSICEAIKITIYQARISYISTCNTQIFNGLDLAKHNQASKERQTQHIQPKGIDFEMQTDSPIEEFMKNSLYSLGRTINRQHSKINLAQALMIQNKRQLGMKVQHFQVTREVIYCFDPNLNNRSKEQIKIKMNQSIDKQNGFVKQIGFEGFLQSQKQSQKLNQKIIKQSTLLSKVSCKKNSKNQQLKKTKKLLQQQRNEISNEKQSQLKKLQSISVQTQNHNQPQSSQKDQEDLKRKRNSQVHSKSPTSKAIETVITQTSELSTPYALKTPKRDMKIKKVNRSMNSLNTSKLQTPNGLRNKSSIISLQQLKNLQLHRNSKMKKLQQQWTVGTQPSELLIAQQQKVPKISQVLKAKALHRISENIHEVDHLGEQKRGQLATIIKDRMLMPLPIKVIQQGELILKNIDFSKSLQKILKNMDMRKNEILNNQHTLKTYLVSYFKCLYGRQLYQNFIQFLITSSQHTNQQLIICFNKLTNSKLPEPYLVDIFRTFLVMLNKCFIINESPTSDRIRSDLLTSMVGLYFEEQESRRFTQKMSKYKIRNLCGWFICLEEDLRSKVMPSELYHFLNQILFQSQDSISYTFVQQLTYFIPSEELHSKNLIRCKNFLGKKTAIHRLAFFCLRYKWLKLLSIQSTIQSEYSKLLGLFNQEQSINNIHKNMPIHAQFKNLSRCLRYQLFMKEKYRTKINSHLLMLCELLIFEYRMKVDFPLSRQLRFINLAYGGLQKKLFHQQLRDGGEEQEGNKKYTFY